MEKQKTGLNNKIELYKPFGLYNKSTSDLNHHTFRTVVNMIFKTQLT